MANKSKKSTPKPKTGPVPTGPMNPELLERLIKLMSENDLSSLDLRDGPQRVSLKRGAQFVSGPTPVAYAAPAPQPAPTPGAPTSAGAAPAAKAPAADPDAGLKPIKSPMVGTFYSAPSPDAKPFVSVGSVLDEETVVCTIEAMKVFNEIKAETRGTIAKVLVQNGATVEFGTVLFLVKP
ncbi:MAG: acetyl-CoA carboxylase biotin carboxyl carrier protein [Tepidisphaeraceae bacterium]